MRPQAKGVFLPLLESFRKFRFKKRNGKDNDGFFSLLQKCKDSSISGVIRGQDI